MTVTSPAPARLAFFYDYQPPLSDFRADVHAGLAATLRQLWPKYLYDEEGSRLFEEITAMPGYYIPQVEMSLMQAHLPDIARLMGQDAAIIELGAGASIKVRALIDGLAAPFGLAALDISGEHLREALEPLARDYPQLKVGGICADFTQSIRLPPELEAAPGRRVVYFPGSTLGNFTRSMQENILRSARALLRPGDILFLGVDLVKPEPVLRAAYDDPEGITARFIMHLLKRIVSELGATLSLDDFAYAARWNAKAAQIEMDAEARRDTTILLDGRRYDIAAGELIAIS